MQLPDSMWLESPSLERLETGSIKDSPTGTLFDLDGYDRAGFCINVQSKNSATDHVKVDRSRGGFGRQKAKFAAITSENYVVVPSNAYLEEIG